MPAITRTWYELMYFQCLFLLMHKTGGRPSDPFVSSPAVLVPSDFAPFFGFFFLRFFFELALGGGVGRSLTELSCLSSGQSVFVAVDDWDGELEYWGLKTARSPYSRGTLQWCSVDIILDVAPDEHGPVVDEVEAKLQQCRTYNLSVRFPSRSSQTKTNKQNFF